MNLSLAYQLSFWEEEKGWQNLPETLMIVVPDEPVQAGNTRCYPVDLRHRFEDPEGCIAAWRE